METSKGDSGEDAIEITENGTLKQGGSSVKWADGKQDAGTGEQVAIEPKN